MNLLPKRSSILQQNQGQIWPNLNRIKLFCVCQFMYRVSSEKDIELWSALARSIFDVRLEIDLSQFERPI